MINKYIKSSEILEVRKDTIVVKVELDIKELVADVLGFANNIKIVLTQLVEKMAEGKEYYEKKKK